MVGDNEAQGEPTLKAVKDKKCPFCGQAFTSSSLGRHLDLYIKDKNPKPPDGIHDVEEIRRLRGGITRRHPRNSLARRETSGTPNAGSVKSPGSDAESSRSPTHMKSQTGASTWEHDGGGSTGREGSSAPDQSRKLVPTRAANRQMFKTQFDMKQKFQDALDTSKAAELALREMIGEWRAARTHVDISSMPFDFDPLSLDFPALTLQCLRQPPTLFSSTQHPTPTSWSITAPGQQQFDALTSYFGEEFRKWRIKCLAAATAAAEDLSHPASLRLGQPDLKETANRAEQAVLSMEEQVTEHLQSAYGVWRGLPQQRQAELWVLELARSVGRRQTELEKLKEAQQDLRQENAKLKTHIEHMSRVQQSPTFRIPSPSAMPMKEAMIDYLDEQRASQGHRGVSLNLDDGRSDLNTVVSKSIDRWKKVIVSARVANSMSSQRPLDQGGVPPSPGLMAGGGSQGRLAPATVESKTSRQVQSQPPPSPLPTPQIQPPNPTPILQPPPKGCQTGTVGNINTAGGVQNSVIAKGSVASSVDDTSDLDADAEMEDDDESYAALSTPVTRAIPTTLPLQAKNTTSEAAALDVQRTRGPVQRGPVGSPYSRSVSHVAPAMGGRGAQMSGSRSVTAMSPAMSRHDQGGSDGSTMGGFGGQPDMDMSLQNMGGDAMYMD